MAKRKKNNENSNLPEKIGISELSDCFADIAESEDELNYLKFNALLRVGMTPHKAAQTVGFSYAFCHVGVYQQLKNPNSALRKAAEKLDNFTKNVAARYRKTFAPLLAGTLAEIDLKMAERMLDDPDLAIRNPAALRQLKQQSGILAEETPTPAMINISSIQTLMLNAAESPRPALPHSVDVVDAETEE